MFPRKLKALTIFALGVGLVVSATGLLVYRIALAQPPANTPAAPPPAGVKGEEKKAEAGTDKEKLQGTWEVVELVVKGEKVLPNEQAKGVVVFKGDGLRFVIRAKGEDDFTRTAATFKLDPAKSPRAIDATATEEANKGQVTLGIYELDGDDLKICLGNQRMATRPTTFKGEGEFVLFKLKRSKK